MDSISIRCWDKSLVEFILKIDDDDEETLKFYNEVKHKFSNLHAYISPRGNGYYDMHHWVNYMCEIAKGDWYFLFNDDARMMTMAWDQVLLHHAMLEEWHGIYEIQVLGCFVNHSPDESFLFVRREVVDILGHFALNNYCDNYIWKVTRFLDSAHYIPIHVDHMPVHQRVDETGKAVLDSHKDDRGMKRMSSMETALSRIKDAQKLAEYLKKRGA